jgi:inosose dehydratase
MDADRGEMMEGMNRREFSKTLAVGLGAAALPGGLLAQQPPARKLKVGHTGITWGFAPADAERAIKDVASLGYHGYESFGNVLENWDTKGGLDQILKANGNLPLRSAYCPVNLINPAIRTDEIAKLVRWGNLIKKCGGSVAVLGPNSTNRQTFNFAANRANIIATLNDMGKALMDIGVVGVMHQHTGTVVESRDETYAVMEGVDTRYVKFGPDVGQLQKGGVDPVQVVKDFQSIMHHVHMKDFNGGPDFLGYCPLGQGKVNVSALADLMEQSGNDIMIMVELDPNEGGRPMPMEPVETARISKAYMQKLGYTFRT